MNPKNKNPLAFISRRRLLSACGAVGLGLPALELFWPRSAHAASENAKLVAFYVPNGKHMQDWTPSSTDDNYELPPLLAPLSPLREKVLVLTGLANSGAMRRVGGDHARGTGSFLTCMEIRTDSEINSGMEPNGISMDQAIAEEVGALSPIKSLQLGVHNNGRDQGYSSDFIQNVSFGPGGRKLPKTVRVDAAFEQVFAGIDPEATAQEVDRRQQLKSSVLDYVGEQASSLKPLLGSSDNQKMEQYLSSVRELEQRIQNAPAPGAGCGELSQPNHPEAVPDQITAMLDVIVLALQCGSTRVVSYMMGNGGDGALSFPWLGIPDHHHSFAHHGGQEANYEKIRTVNLWEIEQLLYLMQKMDSVPDVEGTLLDSSIIMYSSEVADGNRHNHDNLPVLVAGGGAGAFRSGRHIVYPNQTPIANLYISIMQAMGLTQNTFGLDGDGPLDGLT